jgi:hypothetical protein
MSDRGTAGIRGGQCLAADHGRSSSRTKTLWPTVTLLHYKCTISAWRAWRPRAAIGAQGQIDSKGRKGAYGDAAGKFRTAIWPNYQRRDRPPSFDRNHCRRACGASLHGSGSDQRTRYLRKCCGSFCDVRDRRRTRSGKPACPFRQRFGSIHRSTRDTFGHGACGSRRAGHASFGGTPWGAHDQRC